MILVRACRIRKTLIRDFIRRPRLPHFCAYNCARSLNESEQKRRERNCDRRRRNEIEI